MKKRTKIRLLNMFGQENLRETLQTLYQPIVYTPVRYKCCLDPHISLLAEWMLSCATTQNECKKITINYYFEWD